MDIRNCRKCGKVYAYDGHRICRACRKAEEEDFQRVKEYLYDNPGATVQEISDETETSVQMIMKYLREGRLQLRDENHNLILDCEKCGKPIRTGRFCERCADALEKEFKGINTPKHETSKKQDKDKMYIADRHRK